MKNWFRMYKVSASLDEVAPGGKRRANLGDGELQQFEQSMLRLEEELRSSQPDLTVPAGLHGQIMRGVRNSAREFKCEDRRESRWTRFSWIAVPALTSVAIAAAWWVLSFIVTSYLLPVSAPDRRTAVYPVAAPFEVEVMSLLEAGPIVVQSPPATITPLSEEIMLLEQDVKATAEILLASLP